MEEEYEQYEDITKTGGGLTGLPPIYNLPDGVSQRDLETLKQLRLIPYKTLEYASRPQQIEVPIGNTLMDLGYGDSRYDQRVTNALQLENLNEFRAQQQSGAALIANGLGKMATTFGTTVLSSFLGGIAGVALGFENMLDDDENTRFVQGMWNNKVTLALGEFNDKMEKVLPNYYTEYELNAPWYANILTPNSLGDKLLKNAGFMMGAAASMVLFNGMGTVFGAPNLLKTMSSWGSVGKAFGKILPWTLTNFVSANGEAAIEAVNSVRQNKLALDLNLENFIKSLLGILRSLLEQKIALGVDTKTAFEEYRVANDDLMRRVEDYKVQKEKELELAGNSVYGMNVVALMATNWLNMGSFIKGGYKSASSMFENAIIKIGDKTGVLRDFTKKEIGKAILDGTLEANAKDIQRGVLKTIGRWGLNSLGEGILEGVQSEISTTNEILTLSRLNHYARKNSLTDAFINPATTDDFITYADAAMKAWELQFGNIGAPGWEEVFLGALSAGLGMPSIHRSYTANDNGTISSKLKFGWQGGIVEAKNDIYGDRDQLQLLTLVLTQKLQDPKQKQIIQLAIGNISIENGKDDAIERLDIRRYKNLEIAQAVTNALFYLDLGMLDGYLDAYRLFADGVTDEDLSDIALATYNLDTKSTPLSEEQKEDLKQRYRDKAESTINKIENALKNNKELRELFKDKFDANYFDEAITELVYRKSLYDDSIRRKEDLEKLLQDLDGKLDAVSKLLRQDIKNAITQLNKQASELDEWIKKVYDDPKWFLSEIDAVRTDREKYKIAREAKLATQAYLLAKTLNDVAEVYYMGDPNERDNILLEVINTSNNSLLLLFMDFKEDVDTIHKYVDNVYQQFGNGRNTLELLQRVMEMIDNLVVEAAQQQGGLRENLQQILKNQSKRFEEQLHDKVSGPIQYDEFGRFVDFRDREQYMYLSHFSNLFEALANELDLLNDARKVGKPNTTSQQQQLLLLLLTNTTQQQALEHTDEDDRGGEVTDESDVDLSDFGIELPQQEQPVQQPQQQTQQTTQPVPRISNELVQDNTNHVATPSENTMLSTPTQPESTQEPIVEESQEQQTTTIENTTEIHNVVERENTDEPIPTHVEYNPEHEQKPLERQADSLHGNQISPYKHKSLINHKMEFVDYKNSVLTRDQLIKILNFIDFYMQRFIDDFNGGDENFDINFIYMKNNHNVVFLALPYSRLRDVPLQDVYDVDAISTVTTKTDKYIIIGTLGFYSGISALQQSYNHIKDLLFNEVKDIDADVIVSSMHTTMKSMIDGRFIRADKPLSLKDLLESDESNPLELELDDLRFSYIIGNEDFGYTERRIGFNNNDVVYDLRDQSMQPGRVYMYIPTNKGMLMPVFLETQRFNDWWTTNKNTELGKNITLVVQLIAKTDPQDDSRSMLLQRLYEMFVFSGEEYLVFAKNGTVIQKNDLQSSLLYTKLQSIIEEIDLSDFDETLESTTTNKPSLTDIKFDKLMNALLEINPRIAINSLTLEVNPEFYLNSNVFMTDCARLCTVGADFYVNPLDESGTPIEVHYDKGHIGTTTRSNIPKNVERVFVRIGGRSISGEATTIFQFDKDEGLLYQLTTNESGQRELLLVNREKNPELYDITRLLINRVAPTFIIGAEYFEMPDGSIYEYDFKSWSILNDLEKELYFKKKEKLIKRREKEEELRKKESEVWKHDDMSDVTPEPVLPVTQDAPTLITNDLAMMWITDFVNGNINSDAIQFIMDELMNPDNFDDDPDVKHTELFNYFMLISSPKNDETFAHSIERFLLTIYKNCFGESVFENFKYTLLNLSNKSVLDDLISCK